MKKITKLLLLPVVLFFTTDMLQAQNVGIGTTTPQVPLHIKTNSYSEVLRLEGLNPFISFWDNITGFRGSVISRTTYMELYNALPITISPGFTPSVTFLNNGHVGIGTPSPSERLHVIHTADVNKNAIYGYASQTSGSTDYQNTGVTGFGQGNGVAGGYGYGFGVKGIGSLNSYGAVGVYAGLGTTIPANNLLGGSFYALYSDVGTAAANRYAGVFLNGNVGINNTTPQYKLDVNGDANITGALRTNGSAGTSGQVLTSNGAGAPTWTSTSLTNNIRFSATLISTINTASGSMNCTSRYNMNTGVITINSSSISINHAGLYHFDIHAVPYHGAPTYAPYFGLYFTTNSLSYELSRPHNFPLQAPSGGYVENNMYSIDVYLNSSENISITFSLSGGGSSYNVEGWINGYLISD